MKMWYSSLVIIVHMLLFGSKEGRVGLGNFNEFCLTMKKILIFISL